MRVPSAQHLQQSSFPHCTIQRYTDSSLANEEPVHEFSNLKIGARLGLAFGAVLLLMAMLIATGLQRLGSISSLNRTIIDEDWVKAEAAATVSSTTRANSALTLELFIADTPNARSKSAPRWRSTRKPSPPRWKRWTSCSSPTKARPCWRIRDERKAYVASFTQVGKQLADGQRDAALAQLRSDMLPKLSACRTACAN
jgi:methyl-accepting chemotaxis protein